MKLIVDEIAVLNGLQMALCEHILALVLVNRFVCGMIRFGLCIAEDSVIDKNIIKLPTC